ncbi:MAG: hypothetical protein ACK4G4_09190 [Thermus sp.]|uniref:hypothetical protein n=1 Tax=Thermus TaxID=270 RepID=UPI001FA99008|nr:hypothetical protein [Thermus neutrinimicus]
MSDLLPEPDPPLADLTRVRQQAFRGILVHLARTGRFPTGKELAVLLGRTDDATWYALRALGRLGLLERRSGQYALTPRGLRLAVVLGETVWREDEEVQKALRLLRGRDAAEDVG